MLLVDIGSDTDLFAHKNNCNCFVSLRNSNKTTQYIFSDFVINMSLHDMLYNENIAQELVNKQ